jgi:hypothetical protein
MLAYSTEETNARLGRIYKSGDFRNRRDFGELSG